jgi:hypothetical protein
MRVTKTAQVLEHLKSHGTITSWQAIQDYGATRLSAIIFNLRKDGYDIDTKTELTKDRNGNVCQYAKYILNREENKNE